MKRKINYVNKSVNIWVEIDEPTGTEVPPAGTPSSGTPSSGTPSSPSCRGRSLDGIQTPTFSFTAKGAALQLLPSMLSRLPHRPVVGVSLADVLQIRKSIPPNERNCNFLFGKENTQLRARMIVCEESNPTYRAKTKHFAVRTQGGMVSISREEYATLVKSINPLLYDSLAEVSPSDSPMSKKKVHQCREILADTLSEVDERGADEERKKEEVSLLCVNLQGGADLHLRRENVLRVSQCGGVRAVTIDGLSAGETMKEREDIFKCVVENLRSEIYRLTTVDGSPVEVLQAVANGIDVIHVTFPLVAAERGIALDMKIDNFKTRKAREVVEESSRTSSSSPRRGYPHGLTTSSPPPLCRLISLVDLKYNDDFTVLLRAPYGTLRRGEGENGESDGRRGGEGGGEGDGYSRSYVHHLLHVGEMLGTMYLMWHNLLQYSLLFKEIRRCIDVGEFDEFVGWFVESECGEAYREVWEKGREWTLPSSKGRFGEEGKK